MIIKGRSRKHGNALGNYLLSQGRYAGNREDNERIAIWEAPGVGDGLTLHALLRSFELTAERSPCEKPLYHLQMRTADGEHLDRQQWQHAVETTEAALGLRDHQRVIVAHTKDGQDHVHVVWNRIDLETGRAADMWMDAPKRLEAARAIENALGLQQLGHTRGGKLSAKEEAFAIRHGKDPQQIKDVLYTCWQHAETGKEFAAHLDAYGMTLAKGDKRGFLAVDREGDFYLVSRATGSKEKEVREKCSDIERDQLPSLQQVRDQIKERVSADLLQQQAIDRSRLDAQQAQQWQRLEDHLSHRQEMDTRWRQTRQEGREQWEHKGAARSAARRSNRAGMVSVQQDAMRDLRAKAKARERYEQQTQGQQRRDAGAVKYQQSASTRLEERQTRQTERLELQHYFARRRAGVVDPERDLQAQRLIMSRQFVKGADAATLTAIQKEQERLAREQREHEQQARARAQQGQTDERRGEVSDAAERRLARRDGREMTEREKRRQELDDLRARLGITRRDGGRERERER